VRYGGNTSCVELRCDAGELVVIDCGTGAAPLGRALIAAARASGDPLRGTILLSHTHWDHIQGLPFFAPLFEPDGHWSLYGPRGIGTSLVQTLAGQMQYQYFPVTLEQLGPNVEYHDLVEGTITIGDRRVRTQYLNHPALTLGYRIEDGPATFCYLADHEPFDPGLGAGGDVLASGMDRRHVEFMVGADVVVHDAQYVAAEYPSHRGWGHSTIEYVVDAACAAGVGQVVLYHHDPSHDDDAVDAMLASARDRADGRVDVVAAAEGMWLDVRPSGRHAADAAPDLPSAATMPAVEDLATSVVVDLHDPAMRASVVAAATAEGLDVVQEDEALNASRRALLVLDADDGDPRMFLDRLKVRDPRARPDVAVIAVTRSAPATRQGISVTDWIVWPASVAHIRTKLHCAVLRRACRWSAAPLPPDEDRRLDSLRRLNVLDTPPEERFDQYTDAVCASLGVPIALITLVDADRQWFKSRRGLPVPETPRDMSVCAHVILGPDVMQVPDLLEDDRFADNPAVAGPGRARFYAGAPLVLDDGSRVGTLCVVDHRPRLLDDGQLDELRRLAREVVGELQRA
jgi:phosphoribosyl 1,2-cyclic phosphodiesterase